jgi:hypothetical protein
VVRQMKTSQSVQYQQLLRDLADAKAMKMALKMECDQLKNLIQSTTIVRGVRGPLLICGRCRNLPSRVESSCGGRGRRNAESVAWGLPEGQLRDTENWSKEQELKFRKHYARGPTDEENVERIEKVFLSAQDIPGLIRAHFTDK